MYTHAEFLVSSVVGTRKARIGRRIKASLNCSGSHFSHTAAAPSDGSNDSAAFALVLECGGSVRRGMAHRSRPLEACLFHQSPTRDQAPSPVDIVLRLPLSLTASQSMRINSITGICTPTTADGEPATGIRA